MAEPNHVVAPLAWTTITNDVKLKIVELLDYESRCNLKLCSRDDCKLVDASKTFKAEKFSISETISDMDSEKTTIRVDLENFTAWFVGKGNKTRVDRGWNDKVVEKYSEVKQECRYDVVRSFLEKYNRKFGVIHAETINIILFDQPPSSQLKIKCDNLTMYELRGGHDITWFNQCPSQKLEKLDITRTHGPMIQVDQRMLETSSLLRLGTDTKMTDRQLATVKATDFMVISDEITERGVKKFLEYFLNNGGEDDQMQITIALSREYNFEKLIPENIQYKKMTPPPWSSSVFEAQIFGGFENVHEFMKPRTLRVRFTPEKAEISCEMWTPSWRKHYSCPMLDMDDDE